jgi:hypothetical protein
MVAQTSYVRQNYMPVLTVCTSAVTAAYWLLQRLEILTVKVLHCPVSIKNDSGQVVPSFTAVSTTALYCVSTVQLNLLDLLTPALHVH